MNPLGRHWLFGGAVLAALGAPYALSPSAPSQPPSGDVSATQLQAEMALLPQQGVAVPAPSDISRIEGPRAELAEVLRFDRSRDWLLDRWPRIVNAPDGRGRQAYRVPLVTGTAEHDVAGALTYYFGAEQQVQQITFQGTTGNPAALVEHLMAEHGLLPAPAPDPSRQVYALKRDGRMASQLVVKTAPVLRADLPHHRYQIELSLQPPPAHRWFAPSKSGFDAHRWP